MSTDHRPILFLDIDGVISLFGIRGEMTAAREIMVEVPLPAAEKRLERTPALTFDGKAHDLPEVAIIQVCLPNGIDERLRRLDDAFEIIWCTGWLKSAAYLLPAMELDLGPFESLHFEDSKIEALRARAGDRPWAFVDDEIAHELAKLVEMPDGLLIETDPGTGLTESHVQELLAFAAGA